LSPQVLVRASSVLINQLKIAKQTLLRRLKRPTCLIMGRQS